MLAIPCGHCPECIAVKQMNLVQRLQMESLSNHLFFATLTYNNDSLPRITTSTGFSIPYADIRDLQLCFKRLRKSGAFGRPFRYIAVSELGSRKGRPHFHVIFLVKKDAKDDYSDIMNLESVMFRELLHEWRRNYGSNRKPVYRPLCTYRTKMIGGKLRTNYDLHYVNPRVGSSDCSSVAFYVLKYMMKPSDRQTKLQQALRLNLSPEEYADIWRLVHCRYIDSLGFGAPDDPQVISYLRKGIAASKDSPYPLFFHPETGQSFPLARYYRGKPKVYSFTDALDFYFRKNTDRLDSSERSEMDHISVLKAKISNYEKKVFSAHSHGEFSDVAASLYD